MEVGSALMVIDGYDGIAVVVFSASIWCTDTNCSVEWFALLSVTSTKTSSRIADWGISVGT